MISEEYCCQTVSCRSSSKGTIEETYNRCKSVQNSAIAKDKDEHADDDSGSKSDVCTSSSFKASPGYNSDQSTRNYERIGQEQRLSAADSIKPRAHGEPKIES